MVPDSVDAKIIAPLQNQEAGRLFWLGLVDGERRAKPFIVMSSRAALGSEESCRIVGELSLLKPGTSGSIHAILSVDESDVNLNEIRNATDLSEELHESLLASLQLFFGEGVSIESVTDFNKIGDIYEE